MKGPVLPAPPPWFGRLLRRIRASDRPLVQIVAWPASGGRAFVGALRARAREATPLPAVTGTDDPMVWVDDGGAERPPLPADDVAAALPSMVSVLEALRPNQRVVVVTGRLLAPPGRLATVIPPTELLLDPTEIATLLADAGHRGIGADVVAELHRLTDGWYGPLRWLARRDPGRATAAAASPEMHAWLEETVLRRLDHSLLDLLTEAALVDPFDLKLARALHAGAPARRATFRRLERYWLVHTGEAATPVRLPALLTAALARRRAAWPAERWETACRRLTAAALRRAAPAAEAPSEPEEETPAPPAIKSGGVRVRFDLALFGHPRIDRRVGDGPVEETRWRIRRALWTVAFLALADDRRASRDEMVRAVWPDAGESAVERNFHPTLSDARRALDERLPGVPDPIVFHEGLYRLNPAIEWRLDVDRFHQRLEQGREAREKERPVRALAAWRGAWRIYRGPLLMDAEQPWIVERRDELARRHLRLLRDVGDVCVELDREQDALDAYRAILLEDPFDENVHLAVMRLYAARGRRDLVRRQYVKLQEQLKELNVAPMGETQEAYHALMREIPVGVEWRA